LRNGLTSRELGKGVVDYERKTTMKNTMTLLAAAALAIGGVAMIGCERSDENVSRNPSNTRTAEETPSNVARSEAQGGGSAERRDLGGNTSGPGSAGTSGSTSGAGSGNTLGERNVRQGTSNELSGGAGAATGQQAQVNNNAPPTSVRPTTQPVGTPR
jgi:hypothetical protein